MLQPVTRATPVIIVGTLWDQILSEENLRLAWRRAVTHYTLTNHFVDHMAVAVFASRLEENLQGIGRSLAAGEYRLAPLRLAPQLKRRHDPTVPRAMREVFWVEPRDQVAWLAVINVLGPLLDDQMPDWSYGHRLSDCLGVRPSPDRRAILNERLSWPPALAWPIFQRHVLMTARLMRSGEIDSATLDPDERAVWRLEMERPLARRLPYWSKSFSTGAVYCAALDFRTYSGSIGVDWVLHAIRSFVPEADERLGSLIEQMLEFEVDLRGASARLTACEPPTRSGRLGHLPIGLITQGVLCNAAMLPIDLAVSRCLAQRPLAQFRYVDDHVLLSSDAQELCAWLPAYRDIVREHIPTLDLNWRKLRPKALAACFEPPSSGARRAAPTDALLAAALFDPDQPQKLWPKERLILPSSGSLPFAHLRSGPSSNLRLQAIQARLRALRVPSGIRARQGSVPESPDAAVHAVLFAQMRSQMQKLPDSGSLLRQALLFMTQTGHPGMRDLRSDLEALACEAPAMAVFRACLLLQLLVLQVTLVALRLAERSEEPLARNAAISFLLDLEALGSLERVLPSEWSIDRSLLSFRYALRVTRAILSDASLDEPIGSVVSVLDGLLDEDVEKSGGSEEPSLLLEHLHAELGRALWRDDSRRQPQPSRASDLQA